MDQYLSMVIVAFITGVFSVITLIIQKKQEKVINKINEQTTFIEKEKVLKQRLLDKEKEREGLIHQIMILILDTNLDILKNTDVGSDSVVVKDMLNRSDQIKRQFDSIDGEIEEIKKEYEMVLEITADITKQIQSTNTKKKK